MKIEHLLADNFLRLNLFDVDLSETTLHLFAGDNEAGKSSVQEAIRFVCKAETARVTKKGDYKLMIRDGAKSGTVSIRIDGNDLIRDIKTGKLKTEEMEGIAAHLPPYLPYLLDAQRFAHQNHAIRRAFLLELTNTSTETDDIARRMKAKGVHENCIEAVKPMIRSSLDAAHKEAVSKAAAFRAQWVGLTGNARYGSQIAADWAPTPPDDYDPQALLDGEAGSTQLQEAIDGLNIRKGGLVAQLDEAQKAMESQGKAGTFDKKELVETLTKIKAREESLEPLQARRNELNQDISNARERVPVPCCECGAMLRVSFRGKTVHVEPYKPMEEDELVTAEAELLTVGCDISDAGREIDALRARVTELQRLEAIALGGSPKVTQDDIDGLKGTLDAIDLSLNEKRGKLGALLEKLVPMRTAAAQVRDSDQIKDRAQSMHRGVQAWETCVESLAPDGIPAEILSDALKPVNDRLRNTANLTGWPQVTIAPTMEIVSEGRPYTLLSESARWRADTAIAEAISCISEIGILIVDRFDVLDIRNRGAFMRWMAEVDDEYETIMVFGTLKKLPMLPVTMSGHWIENGEIVHKESE